MSATFTVSAGTGTPNWTFTYGVSDPEDARRYYSEVMRVPLERVIVR